MARRMCSDDDIGSALIDPAPQLTGNESAWNTLRILLGAVDKHMYTRNSEMSEKSTTVTHDRSSSLDTYRPRRIRKILERYVLEEHTHLKFNPEFGIGIFAHHSIPPDTVVARGWVGRRVGPDEDSFSVIYVQSKAGNFSRHLLFGAAALVNHACEKHALCILDQVENSTDIVVKTIKPVAPGQHITAYYGIEFDDEEIMHCEMCATPLR